MYNRLACLLFCIPVAVCAQSGFTADDVVPPFKGRFGYGANVGYFPPYYYDKELAALAHGTPDGKVQGFGVNTIRPGLFEFFLDQWGYSIRRDYFEYYKNIGLEDIVVFIGFPSERHRDNAFYCPGQRSELFKNLYEPIWDNGENGTPVNEANPYALYVWKMVSEYKDHVKFWEVWNEPDVDTGNAWKTPGLDGNWWENPPGVCETKLRAPIYNYIRTLRITYEIVKKIDPDDYVCVGGLGWPSYLDAILRYTDDPFDGKTNEKYPKTGGAYFDCMSFHSYPHIDNSLRTWDNSISGFRYFRHSDAAVNGIWRLKERFNEVLARHGYDNKIHPEKVWICTEFNLPRKEFGDYLGSDIAQVNFMIKTLVTAQQNNMAQMHVYSLADEAPEREATSEFGFMGFFKNLNNVLPFSREPTDMAWAYKTTSDLLSKLKLDRARTERLRLPANVKGAAFKDEQGAYTYVLWAVTDRDRDESAEASYAFPEDFQIKLLEQKYWHYSHTGARHIVNAGQVQLSGSPVFLTASSVNNSFPRQPKLSPNPARGGYSVFSFWMYENAPATIEIFDASGRRVQSIAQNETLIEGPHSRLVDLSQTPNGVYYIRVATPERNQTIQMVKY